MSTDKSEASVGQLFSSLATDTSALVRQELQLAATEMAGTARTAAQLGGLVAAGGALIHVGCIAALVAVMVGLQPLVPLWASAAVLGLAFVGIGFALVQTGVGGLRRLDPVPRATLSTLRADGL